MHLLSTCVVKAFPMAYLLHCKYCDLSEGRCCACIPKMKSDQLVNMCVLYE